MVLSWPVRDALLQVEALVARKAILLQDGSAKSTATPNDFTNMAKTLSALEVTQSLKLVQLWLCKSVVTQEVAEVFDRFMALATKYEIKETNVEKGATPSTTDKKATVDDKIEDTVSFYCIDSMVKILQSVLGVDPTGGAARKNDLLPAEHATGGTLSTLQPVVPFAFNYVQHIWSPAIRHASSRLLGALSHIFLSNITLTLLEKYGAAKNDDLKRQFASFQSTVGFLEFGVGTPQRVNETNHYLAELAKEMKKIDRGILRQEICVSLEEIFAKVLSSDPVRKAEFDKFQSIGGEGYKQWEANYRDIFEKVGKWSSKNKHAVFSWKLLLRMVVLTRNVDFYRDKKRFDVFKEVVNGLGKKEFRYDSLQLLTHYVKDLPIFLIKADDALWNQQVKLLMTTLFPKKSVKPADDEIPLMTDLTIAVGLNSPDYIVTEVVMEMLKPGSQYYSRQKAIALKALGTIANQRKGDILNYIFTVGPFLEPFIEEMRFTKDDKQVMMLRAALASWPHVRGATAQQVRTVAATIVPLTMHEDREIATLAMMCLQEFSTLDINANFLSTFHSLIDILSECIPIQPVDVLKACNNLTLLLQTLEEYITNPPKPLGNQTAPKPFAPSAEAWITLREHLETVSVSFLTHPEGWVRCEILRVLVRFNKPIYNNFEATSGAKLHHLIDSLLPGVTNPDDVQATPETFYTPLKSLLAQKYTIFSGVLSTSWAHQNKSIGLLSDDSGIADQAEEWLPVLKNQLLYLCLTIRPASQPYTPTQQPPGSPAHRNSDRQAFPSSAEELTRKFNVQRTRLNAASVESQEVHQFYHQLCEFFQSPNAKPAQSQLRTVIAETLAIIHHSNYDQLLTHLRTPLTAQPDPKAKGRQLEPRAHFYYHEHTLDLLSRLFVAMTPEEYHSKATLLTKTLDELIAQWASDPSELVGTLGVNTRFYMASLISRFIAFRSYLRPLATHTSKADLSRRRSFFFRLLTSLLRDSGDSKQLQGAVLSGVASLIALGTIEDTGLAYNILSFLEHVLTPQTPQVISDRVALCLQLFLRLNPERFSEFIRFTISEVHTPSSALFFKHGVFNEPYSVKVEGAFPPRATAVIITRYYMKALCAGLMNDFDFWHDDQNIDVAEMLAIGLYHLGNSDNESRIAALLLIDELLKHDNVILDDSVRLYTPTAPFMYAESSVALSAAIANHGKYIPSLSVFFRRAKQLFQWLPDSKKALYLNALTPWVAQFSSFVDLYETTDRSKDLSTASDDIFTSLFEITRMSSSVVLTHAVKQFWGALLTTEKTKNTILDLILGYVIKQYATLFDVQSQQVTPSAPSTPPLSRMASTSKAPATPTSQMSPGRASVGGEGESKDTTASASNSVPASPASNRPASAKSPSNRALAEIPVDHAIAVPAVEEPSVDVPLHKQLLRLIIVNLARSVYGPEIISRLIALLRKYEDTCPTDPAEYVSWLQLHSIQNEPVTATERATFELIVNLTYERTISELAPHLPTLILNAYVLFPGSQLSDELLRNVALALRMLKPTDSGDMVVSEGHFFHTLCVRHPDVRVALSDSALSWSLSSRDPMVGAAAFRIYQELEEKALYFGEGQRNLIRQILSVFACIKAKDTRKLKSIVSVFLMPTEVPYDKNGWGALVIAGFALLHFNDVVTYSLGLSLLIRMLGMNMTTAKKRAWLLSLGSFANGEGGSIDGGIYNVLFKGVIHPSTQADAMTVLQYFSELYAGSDAVPSANQLFILLSLMNILLRGNELNKALEVVKVEAVTQQQLLNKERALVQSIDSVASVSVLAFNLADADRRQSDSFKYIANLFKNLALSLSQSLPDADVTPGAATDVGVKLSVDTEKSNAEDRETALAEERRTALYAKLSTLMEFGPVEQIGALTGQNFPTLMQLFIPFFKVFAGLYNAPEHHEVIILFFTNVLERAPADWRYTTEFMLGRYLLETPQGLSNSQFSPLADIFVQSYFSSDHDEFHLAENLGFLMVQKKLRGEASPLTAFNLVRSRASIKRPQLNLSALASPPVAPDQEGTDEVREATEILQRHAFPVLVQMNTEPRHIERIHAASNAVEGPNVTFSQNVITSFIGAASIASDSLVSSKLLDPALTSGLHTAPPVVLANSAPASAVHSKATSAANSQPTTPKQNSRRAHFRDLPTVIPTPRNTNHVEQNDFEPVPVKTEVNPFAEDVPAAEEEPAEEPRVKPVVNPFAEEPSNEVAVPDAEAVNGNDHAPKVAVNPFDATEEDNSAADSPSEEFQTPTAADVPESTDLPASSNPFD